MTGRGAIWPGDEAATNPIPSRAPAGCLRGRSATTPEERIRHLSDPLPYTESRPQLRVPQVGVAEDAANGWRRGPAGLLRAADRRPRRGSATDARQRANLVSSRSRSSPLGRRRGAR